MVVLECQAVAVHGLQRELLPLLVEGGAVALPAAVAGRWPGWPGGGLAAVVVERQAVAVLGPQRALLPLVIEVEAVAQPAAVAVRWPGR